MDVHYYLISRKRSNTTHTRFRDQIGQVIADKSFPPFKKGSVKMRKVDWWHGYQTPNTACSGLAPAGASDGQISSGASR